MVSDGRGPIWRIGSVSIFPTRQFSAMVGDHFRQMKTQIFTVGDDGDGIRSLPIL